MSNHNLPEPWLRGTLSEVPAVQRAVLHALELAREDIARWCGGLTDAEVNATPGGLPSVAFHVRHISRSIDRLLTYAEGRQLDEVQEAALLGELNPGADLRDLFAEFNSAMTQSIARLRSIGSPQLDQPRTVGVKQLPTTVAGLLVHIADHGQRHVGQAITTAKILLAQRSSEPRTSDV